VNAVPFIPAAPAAMPVSNQSSAGTTRRLHLAFTPNERAHRMKWIVLLIAALAIFYAAYAIAYPTYSYRYRITIEVDTSDGVKTGSSVIEVTTVQYPSWITLGANDHATSVRGEAVFVDLGSGRNLVALLALGPHAADGAARLFAPRSFFPIRDDSPRDVLWSKQLAGMTGRRAFAGDKQPTLVTFADPNDPAGAREVPFSDPQSVLGSDIRSVRAWIDLTKDPVTSTLQSKLPWIGDFQSAQIAWRIVQGGQYVSSAPLTVFRRVE